MRVIRTIKTLRKTLENLRQKGNKIGFVPTMGYFHEGHLSLMRQARKDCKIVVVSIYVNPKQFDSKDDLVKYPRDIKRDASMIKKENVDILFIPSDNDVYQTSYLTYIDVEKISNGLCGQFRPGHFKGVATVVAKLLNMVQPHYLYLGQKDAQQVVVLKQMVADLNFPVTVKVVPTAREADGLAMSSRNVYLNPQERAQAPILYQSLKEAVNRIKAGERSVSRIVKAIQEMIYHNSIGKIQYIACVNADTLEPLEKVQGKVLIALAVLFNRTRLIDNVIIPIKKSR